MKVLKSDNIVLLIDLEATCWEEDGRRQKEESEIIEIGGAILYIDNENKETVITSFFEFIRPIRNPVLSDFCKNLTSIRQEDVNTAHRFPEALQAFLWAAKSRLMGKEVDQIVFGSWGGYDCSQLNKDCAYHGVKYPFGLHWNVKNAYSKYRKVRKGFGLAKAAKQLGLEFEGQNHRGVYDAKMIATIVSYIYKISEEENEIVKVCKGENF